MSKRSAFTQVGSTARAAASGHAVIELAVCLPVLVLMCLVGIEFSRSLAYIEAAGTFSREAAFQAYRDCAGSWRFDTLNKPELQNKLDSCLDLVRDGMERVAEANFPNTQIILSLFRYDSVPANEDCTGAIATDNMTLVARIDGGTTPPRKKSQIQFGDSHGGILVGARTGDTLSGDLNKRTLCLNRAMIVAEAFVPYTSIAGRGAKLFVFNPEVFYNVTAM